MSSMISSFIIPVAVSAVFMVVILYFINKRFPKNQKTAAEVKKDEPPPFVKTEAAKANVLLFQPLADSGIMFAKMREELIPPGCQQYLADWVGKWLYFLENHDGKFTPYEPPSIIEQLPSELLEAIQMPANRKLWSLSHNPLEKIAMWAPVVVAGAGMILLFAMAN